METATTWLRSAPDCLTQVRPNDISKSTRPVNLPRLDRHSTQVILLMDIRINQAGNGFMPAIDATSNSAFTSRVRSFNDVSSATGTADTLGLVTQFSTPQGTPEPSAQTTRS